MVDIIDKIGEIIFKIIIQVFLEIFTFLMSHIVVFTLIIFIMLPVFIYLYIKKILEYLKFKKEMKEKAKLYTGENSITNKSIKERYL